MAKKQQKAQKETSKEAATEKPSPLSDDQLQVLFFQHKKSWEARLAAKKKADADLKNAGKLAKAELGEGAVDRIKTAIALEIDEGEATLKAKIESDLQVARWMGAAIGSQFEMFNGTDRTPAVDRAFADGKRAGMQGHPAKPPHSPDTEQYRKWMSGHSEGNAALGAKGFRPMSGVVAAGDAHIKEVSAKMSAAADSLTH